MRQFILPEDWDGGTECRVRGRRARYLVRVLRLVQGDGFVAMDGSGRRWQCSVLEIAPQGEALRLGVRAPDEHGPSPALRDIRGGAGWNRDGRVAKEAAPSPVALPVAASPRVAAGSPPVSPASLILVQGLPRGSKMDLVVRQATEAGVGRIIPLVSRRCAPSLARDASSREDRWRRIVREALQQSGSAVPTSVDPPVRLHELDEALRVQADPGPTLRNGTELRLLFHETPLAQGTLHGYLTDAPARIVLCVGPEGGFADDEVSFLQGLGFLPLHLGGAVLRTETAALFAVAAVEIVLSERSSWIPKPL